MLQLRFAFASLFVASACFGTSIDATSATGALSNSGSSTWGNSTSSALATIRWQTGEDDADNKQFCLPQPCPEGREPKFDKGEGATLIKGRKFKGFDTEFGDEGGSKSLPSGGGMSRVVDCPTPKPGNALKCGIADWTVKADGLLGTDTSKNRSWVTHTEGGDPWPLFPEDFSGLGPTVDLWIPLGITGVTLTEEGIVGLAAQYETAAGSLDLLNIGIGEAGARVQAGALAGIRYYLLSDILEAPTADPSALLTAAQIQAMIDADLAGGDTLHNPLLIGIYVPGLTVPTVTLADGSLAAIHVDASAFDQASAPGTPTPEPSSWALALIGVALLAVSKFKFS